MEQEGSKGVSERAGSTGDPGQPLSTIAISGHGGIVLPEGFPLLSAHFDRVGSDLVVRLASGDGHVLQNYFDSDIPPEVSVPSGVRMSGELVVVLSGENAPAQLAEAILGVGVQPIGKVAVLNGELNAIRLEGGSVALAVGDGILPGDTLEAGPTSIASLALSDDLVVSLSEGSRIFIDPAAVVSAESENALKLNAEHGVYAFACGAAPQSIILDTPAAQIKTDGAFLLLTYLEDRGLQVILLPGPDGAVGGIVVANNAGNILMTVPYELVSVTGADLLPKSHGVIGSDEITAAYSQVLFNLPPHCNTTPIVASAKAQAEEADLAGDSGSSTEENLEALVEFATAAGDAGDASTPFTDQVVIVTKKDPLARTSAEFAALPQFAPPASDQMSTPISGNFGNFRNQNEALILGQIPTAESQIVAAEVSRTTFPTPGPASRPPVARDLTVSDWDPGLRQWTVLVAQEPTAYTMDTFYRPMEPAYDEPVIGTAFPLTSNEIERQYSPTDGADLFLMSAGPWGTPQETGRAVEARDIEIHLGLAPGGLPSDDGNPADNSRAVDGAVMRSAGQIHVNPGQTIAISFDWAFDARDETAFNDYAVFTITGLDDPEVFKLTDIRSIGAHSSSGWRKSVFEYTAPSDQSQKSFTVGFAVVNDSDDANEPRLLLDNVRLDESVPSGFQLLDAPEQTVDGNGALSTYALPPIAFDDPSVVLTTEDSGIIIGPGIVLANDEDANQNVDHSLTVTAVDGSAAIGVVTLDNGSIRYDPAGRFEFLAAGETTTDSFEYEITNLSGGTDTAIASVVVQGVNDTPIANIDGYEAGEDGLLGNPASLLTNDSDTDATDVIAVSAVNGNPANVGATVTLYSGGLLNVAADGTFVFNPNGQFEDLSVGEQRGESFEYTISDGNGGTATATVTLAVVGANDAPTANDDSASTNEDTVLEGAVSPLGNDSDPDRNDTLSVTEINGVAVDFDQDITVASGASLSIRQDWTFVYDPNGRFESLAVGESQEETFTYTASDGNGGADIATVTVTVSGANDAPTANAVSRSTNEDAATFDIDLLGADVTSDVDAGDNLIITDVVQDIGASDRDLGNAFTLTGGIMSLDTRAFDNLRAGESESVTWVYSVDDQRGESNSLASNTIVVTVDGRNDVPIAGNNTYATFEDSPLNVLSDTSDPQNSSVLANDLDLDRNTNLKLTELNGSAASVGSQIKLPSGALLSANADGSFTYEQNGQFDFLGAGESTADSFTYTVDDDDGGTASATVTVRITGVNDPPVANNDTAPAVANEDVPLSIDAASGLLINDSDAEGDRLRVAEFSSKSALGVDVTVGVDGNYTYDPSSSDALQALAEGQTATDTFSYRVDDGRDLSATATVTVTAQGANDAPDAADTAFRTFKRDELTVDIPRSILSNDTDVDAGTDLQVLAVNGETSNVSQEFILLSGALLTVNADGRFSYNPNGQFDGLGENDTAVDSFTYAVSDSILTDTATVTITVTGFPEEPLGSFETQLSDWNSVGAFTVEESYIEPDGSADRFDPTDGPKMAVLGATGSFSSNIEDALRLPSGALPSDDDSSSPNTGSAIWREISVKKGDVVHFDWNFDANDAVTGPGLNDFAVFTISDGTVSKVFELSDIRETGDFGASGWQAFSYDPTIDFGVSPGGKTLTIGFAVANDQSDLNPSHLLVDNVRLTWTLPAPVDDSYTFSEDDILAADPLRNLLANDRDDANTGALRIFSVNGSPADVGVPLTLASGAILTVNEDGTFALDASASPELQNLAVGEQRLDAFTYSIEDGNDRSSLGTATVRLTFDGANDAPAAAADIAVTGSSSSVRITADRLLANDSDPDGSDALAIVGLDDSATAGLVTLGDDGLITYDPNGQFAALAPGATATDTFAYIVSDGNDGSDTATVTVTIQGEPAPAAFPGEIVASFEEPQIGGWSFDWHRLPPTSVSLVSQYTETDGTGETFLPTGGDQMVVLEASGAFEDPSREISTFLNVSAAAIPADSDGSSPKDGAAMKSTLSVKAGDQISFDWVFDARDQITNGTQAFNDFAIFTVSGPNGSEVFTLSDVRETGSFGASGWRTSTYQATTDGEITLGFAVINDEISHGDNALRNSRLMIDNIRLDKVFDSSYQVLDGLPTDPFQTLAQMPTGGDDTFSTTEDGVLRIAAADLLSNDAAPASGGTISLRNADPTGLTGQLSLSPDGTLLYDPQGRFESLGAGETASDTFTYTIAASNGATATAQVTVTVAGVNDAPVASDDAFATTEDTPVAGSVFDDNGAGADIDPDGDTLMVSRVNGSASNVDSQISLASGSLLLLNADGTFSYDPNGRFEALKPNDRETDTFTYTVDDGNGGTATATAILTIRGVNDAPVANDDTRSTTEDAPISIAIFNNDVDAEGDLLSLVGLNDSATLGVLTPNDDGTVTYDPSGKFDSLRAGETATDTFSYSVNDGSGEADTATVTVEVVGVNDAPVATNDFDFTTEANSVVIAVRDNDSDAESDPLTIIGLDDSATAGEVALNADGTVTYDPNGRFDGLTNDESAIDTFRYTISDGNGGTSTASVTVTVNGLGGGPTDAGQLVESFEGPIDSGNTRGQVSSISQYIEPDGDQDQYSPTDGSSMAELSASGTLHQFIEFFLGITDPFPSDIGDSSQPADGSALRLTIDVKHGDEVSFDWMFDSNDVIAPPLGSSQGQVSMILPFSRRMGNGSNFPMCDKLSTRVATAGLRDGDRRVTKRSRMAN